MKYFLYFAFAVVLFYALRWFVGRCLLSGYWQKRLYGSLMRRQSGHSGEKFFARPAVGRLCAAVLKKRGGEEALQQFSLGRDDSLLTLLKKDKKKKELAILQAFSEPEKALRPLVSYLKKNPKDTEAAVYLAELYFLCARRQDGMAVLEKLPPKINNRYLRALKNYLLAQDAVSWGGMKEASEYGSAAVAGFEKMRAPDEQAQAQLLMGTIYRVSAIADVSEFMLRAAHKIYEKNGSPSGMADSFGNLGMLMVMQKRFAEADDYFAQALDINIKQGRKIPEAEIINQMALLALLKDNPDTAEQKARQAQKIHRRCNNRQGEAFSLDVLSYVFLRRKQYDKLRKTAAQAEKRHAALNDEVSRQESLYLLATAYFEEDNPEAAEKTLRRMIAAAGGKRAGFYLANAYSLLGLIYLQKGELLRAKGLFSQAVQLEQKNDRLNAAAADYANIALIEARRGQKELARKNLETAIECAGFCEDDELKKTLQAELQKYD